MAVTVYGTNATKKLASPVSLVEQGDVNGRVHVAYDEYTFTGAELADASTIKMGMLPTGARVIDVILSFTDMGTTGTCIVGWESNGVESADDNGFLTTVDMNAAANTVSMQDEANVPGFGKKFSAPTQVNVLTSAASTATSGTIKLVVEYVLD